MLRFTALLLALPLLTLAGACQSSNAEMQEQLNDLLEAYEEWGFSGTVLVAKGPDVLFVKGYGYANRASGERNTATTRYDFASIAKTFTGAAVLQLEADGVLKVDDPLESYIGPFPDQRKAEATFAHLATHTAGLTHRRDSQLAYGPDRTAYIESVKQAPFETRPGESYRYSNAGASFLAALVEETSGVPFDRFVQDRFAQRLGLPSVKFASETASGEPGLALGYQDASQTPAPDPYEDDWGWGLIGATGFIANVEDIHKWFDALYNGDLLPVEQRRKAFDPDQKEAYGWHTDRDDAGRLRVHKGGGLTAMQSQVRAYPEQDVVIVWAHNNMTDNWRRALNDGVTALALGESFGPIPQVNTKGPSPDQSLRPGVYATTEGTMVELEEDGGNVVLGLNGLGFAPGTLKPGTKRDWILFSPEDLSWLQIKEASNGGLQVIQGPDGTSFELSRTHRSPATMLQEPSNDMLMRVRRYAEALLKGDTQSVWEGTLYRPIRETNSLDDWNRRVGFLTARVGPEKIVLEEAWVLRHGSWRYWRSYESESGAQALLRFKLTSDGQIAGYGMNPVQGAPEAEEKRVIP